MNIVCRSIGAGIVIGGLGLLALVGCDSRSPGSGAPTAKTAATATTQAKVDVSAAPADPKPATPAPPASPASPVSPASPATPATPATAPPSDPAPIVVEPAVIDMGYVTGGATKIGRAKLRNTGTKLIVISRIQPNCTCTTVGDLTGVAIMPGDAAEVTAKYVAPQDTGPKQAKVWAWFQGYDDPVTIPVLAEVALPIRADPGYLKDELTAVGVGEIRIESIDGKPFRVLATDGKPAVYKDGFKEGETPRNSYVLEWDLRPYMEPCKDMPWWWIVETDHPQCPLIDVRVRHKCNIVATYSIHGQTVFLHSKEQKWRTSSLRALAGVIPPGGSTEVAIPTENLAGRRIVTAVPLTANLKAVEIVGTEAKDGEPIYMLKVTPAPGRTGLLMGIVQFTAEDGTQSAIWIIGTIR